MNEFPSDLPPELLLHIFTFLPLSSLLRIQLVSRTWKELARDNSLWRTRLQKNYLVVKISPIFRTTFRLNPILLREYPKEIYQIFYMKSKRQELDPLIYRHRVMEIIEDLEYNLPLLVDLVRHFRLLEVERVPESIKRNGHPKIHEYSFQLPSQLSGTLYWSRRSRYSKINIIQPGLDISIISTSENKINIGRIYAFLKFIETVDQKSLTQFLSGLHRFSVQMGFKYYSSHIIEKLGVPTIFMRIE